MSLQIGALNPDPASIPAPSEVVTSDTITREDGSTAAVQKIIRRTPYIRKRTMADVRAQEWKPFGMSLMSDLEAQNEAEGGSAMGKGGKTGGAKYVDLEGAVNFELGSTDPIEKKVRDEVTRINNDMQRQAVKSDDVAKLRKRIENLKKNLDDIRGGNAAVNENVVIASPVASPTSAGPSGAKTWADRNREAKGLPARAPVSSGPPGRHAPVEGAIVDHRDVATGRMIKIDKSNLRITNIGAMTETEFDRIFGYESDLPRAIRKTYSKGPDPRQLPIDDPNYVELPRVGRGFGFVSYASVKDAEIVRNKINGMRFKGGVIGVDYSEVKKPN